MAVNKKWVFWGVVILVAVGAYFVNVEVQSHLGRKALSKSGLEIHDLDEALATAGAQSKLVLADVSAIWCPSCRSFDKNVLSDEQVKAAIRERFIFARIEYESDQGQAFQKQHGLSGFPNLLILDPHGNKVKQLRVTMNPEDFRSQLAL